MAVGDTPTGGAPPKRPYRFEGILVAAARFDRAAEPVTEAVGSPPVADPAGGPVTGEQGPPRAPVPPAGFEFEEETSRRSHRWLVMVLVALLASTLVLVFVDLRPGVVPGRSPGRCAPSTLEEDLGTVDGTDFAIVDQRCGGGFAFLMLEPVIPGPDPVFIAAEDRSGAWVARHHSWLHDCEAVREATEEEVLTELCEAMAP